MPVKRAVSLYLLLVHVLIEEQVPCRQNGDRLQMTNNIVRQGSSGFDKQKGRERHKEACTQVEQE